MGHHLLIVNTHSGGGRTQARIRALLPSLRTPGEVFDTVFTEAPGHARQVAEEEAPNYDTLIAVGGDGTVSEIATGLLQACVRKAVLAILPMGTGNDIAHGIGIHRWEDGVASLTSRALHWIDACETGYTTQEGWDKRLSLVGSGVGLPAEVTARATRRVKRLFRHHAYLVTGIAAAICYRSPEMRLVVDGREITGRFRACVVANMERTGGQRMVMAPGALCDDGLLNVSLLAHSSPRRLLTCLARIRSGKTEGFPEYTGFCARDVLVESNPAARLNLDGELSGTTPVRFRVLPGVLPVRTPDRSV